MASADAWLEWLGAGAHGRPPGRSIVVVAHPDDESVGLGGHLAALKPTAVVCVTDGAPRRLPDAPALAERRRRELEAALEAAGLGRGVLRMLGAPDQETIFRIAELARALRGVVAEVRPDAVFAHAYEGGHPDHDASALAVQCAVRGLSARPTLLEFAAYNVSGLLRFLPGGPVAVELALDQERRKLKARLVACHASQREVLAPFPLDRECVRSAPDYDFRRPPHDGPLHYERYDWGVDGTRWRALATEALACA
jgi:LmbE family N-acetylglucosaminyl deacetylase